MTNSNEDDGIEAERSGLHTPQRNQYFYGKLMTPRNMRMEQDYHAGQLNRHSQFVAGHGIVCGLNISEPQIEDDVLEVTVEPGFAVDGYGRQIIVEPGTPKKGIRNDKTNEFAKPPQNVGEIDIYITHDEVEEEEVPVPGTETASEERTDYDRIKESFDLYYRDASSAPDHRHKDVRDVSFPEVPNPLPSDFDHKKPPKDRELKPESVRRLEYRIQLNRIAKTYQDDCKAVDESHIFIGALKREQVGEDEWTVVRDEDRTGILPYVYSNDMIYAGTSRLALQVQSLEQHRVKSVLKDTQRAFEEVDREFSSGTAKGIADNAEEELKNRKYSPGDFMSFINKNDRDHPYEEVISDIEADVKQNEDFDRFKKSIIELKTVRDKIGTPSRDQQLYFVMQHDWVNETTTWLEKAQ